MQEKNVKAVYGPRLVIAIGIILVMGILLIIHNSLANSVSGIKQVFVPW